MQAAKMFKNNIKCYVFYGKSRTLKRAIKLKKISSLPHRTVNIKQIKTLAAATIAAVAFASILAAAIILIRWSSSPQSAVFDNKLTSPDAFCRKLFTLVYVINKTQCIQV